MSQKRSYSQSSQSYKRQRTNLNREVNRLKRQVAVNKKELKYYDGLFVLPGESGSITAQSIFTNVVDDNGLADNPVFVGRKAYIKKIELRVASTNDQTENEFLMWREKRQGKDPNGFLEPLAFDPEYHTKLRTWEQKSDTDTNIKFFSISFGNAGRLVEYDEQATAIAEGTIVAGDIKCSLNTNDTGIGVERYPISFRVWYCDG